MYLYADDAKLFSSNPADLQNAINNLHACLQERQLALAPSKCEHLALSRTSHSLHNISSSLNQKFFIDSHEVNTVSRVRDLGIIISSDLKWASHISHIHHIASVRVFHILRAFSSRVVWTLLRAFTAYVRPILEYNSSVWSPYLKKDIILLESIQKKFTRNICVRCNISFESYTDRLNKLNLKSLEYRRIVNDLTLLYKICHGLSDLSFSDFFVYQSSVYNLRKHNWTIQPITRSSQLLQSKHFFVNRIPPVWNNLPEAVVAAPSLYVFKKRLKMFDLHNIVDLVF